MVPIVVDNCNTWGTVFAMFYTTAHGTPTLANLPEVLKQIQDEYGAAWALDFGMQLVGNFATVSSIILSNLKGEAVALAVRMRLWDVPPQDQEHKLPKIIAEIYSSIGQESLGARPTKPQFQGKSNKDSTKQAAEGTKKRWDKKQQTFKKERGESLHPETPQNRYDLRNGDNIKALERYQYIDTHQSHSFQESEKRSEIGGQSERTTEYVKLRQESQRSTEVSVKKEDKLPQQKTQVKKKKVAVVAVQHSTQEEGSLEEQGVGTSAIRQHGRGHNSSPESSRASGGESS
ncbi:hypothetical protein NDU88_004666 [Pleurodeles waltl]|uniref:Uncharacterized protein n=1 Tax=Pleurodeles waltl TaxID=8319 RepID=A0AAV7RGV2_PLEWA|nr:hypothetical protein NDU88_004666 [Pleurodeles waltl]